MIDGNHTTLDWQRHSGSVCILPVGSFEQHSAHLPLDTDSIESAFFARALAEDLDAALLPAQRFATCLEQSGFRGSLTLRPETLMQIVRDVADELERQQFDTLIIVNGHGGNHALVPVARDINRLDRRIKILLVNFWDFGDPESFDCDRLGTEIHSGAWETSLMLALRPELVHEERIDMAPAKHEPRPLKQADLTTFGVGTFSPGGAIGFPTYASAEAGRRIVDSIRRNLLAHVRDRLERLAQQRRYAGSGGIAVRPLWHTDIPAGMRLKRLAGWNQTEADWELYLASNPDGCFAAVANGAVVGTITAVSYADKVAWIGMVLVDPAFRRLGIATQLMTAALESLVGCETVKLDATPSGKKVYDKLGFIDEYGIGRLVAPAVRAPETLADGVEPLAPGDLAGVLAAFDAEAFGIGRRHILEALAANAPNMAWKRRRDGQIVAYCLGRRGENFDQIGPVVARDSVDAIAVVGAAATRLAGRAAVVDVPEDKTDFRAFLAGLGFAEQRAFIRMFRGANACPGRLAWQFAISGPELG